MAETRRIQKVNELIKREVSGIIDREMNFNNDTLVTVMRVEAAQNLSEAKVYLSVLPENKKLEALQLLNENIYELQQLLNKDLKMRPVPKISFHIDKGQAKAEEVYKILNQPKNN